MPGTNQKQTSMQNYILLFCDLLSICASYALAIITRQIIPGFMKHTQYYMLILFFAVILCMLSYVLFSLNSRFLQRNRLAEFFFVLKYDFFIGAGLGVFLFLTQKAQDFSRLAFAYFCIYNMIFTYLLHLMAKHFMTKVYMRSKNSSKMLVVTQRQYVDKIIPPLKSASEWSHEVTALALMDTDLPETEKKDLSYHGIPVIAFASDLYDCLQETVLDEVMIYLPNHSNKLIGSMIQKFETAGIVVHVNIDPYDHLITHKMSESFAGFSVMTYSLSDYDFHRMAIKRIMDIIGAIIGLAVTLILTPFIAIAIKTDSKGPVFYRQKRIGLNGRKFNMIKFRSMYADADKQKEDLQNSNEMNGPIFKISDDPRITRVGKFLRRTSLDELPQFYNILIGQMSLVGTRPPTQDEYTQYKLQYRRRLSIKPGLTGLWQVSGRSNITDFEEILRLDLHYIDHWSLGLDIKILFQTLSVVLQRNGAE